MIARNLPKWQGVLVAVVLFIAVDAAFVVIARFFGYDSGLWPGLIGSLIGAGIGFLLYAPPQWAMAERRLLSGKSNKIPLSQVADVRINRLSGRVSIFGADGNRRARINAWSRARFAYAIRSTAGVTA
ncbi:MAG: hypothetical protein Q4G22_14520 [Paracoccus sp. (in: a-proteobacteria)]|uniref:hypothetical protein n=1 Tax=Paracoccus sp. TaxID=267 RepID=UPI0026E0FACB|nr:hypothetical protein [Paracoccus sp. (in: a-proteobacteria)]MDO5633028.1 hypothetical protein [Paracoccus sp. (in: a-proteobacteria)]